MSRKREDRMRQALGIKPLPVVHEIAVCPIHGVVHDAGPCATDKPVIAVVVLAQGETVRRPGQSKARPKVRRPWMGYELSREMNEAGVTDATVRWLVTRYINERELAGPVPGVEV
jgi:hypothetical protein